MKKSKIRRYRKSAKGYFGSKRTLGKKAREQVEKGWVYAYAHRKQKIRQRRQKAIRVLNNFLHENSETYRNMMFLLKKKSIKLNVIVLSLLATKEPEVVKKLITELKN